jgi:hypothetical protein
MAGIHGYLTLTFSLDFNFEHSGLGSGYFKIVVVSKSDSKGVKTWA